MTARSLILVICTCLPRALGHVSLTFPPARNYPLDFLDSVRTKGPCGMPKGDERTKLQAGTSINVTWHLAYPHKGGFSLEVLDPKDRPIRTLTPVLNGSLFIAGDPTAQYYPVSLPKDLKCIDCSIRLVRQANEWGSKYQFWSCADVDILPLKDIGLQTCSGHGRAWGGRCRCNPLHYGEQCQYHEECADDDDCGVHGKCWDTQSTSAPRKQCFCQKGFFGEKCNKRNPKILSDKKFQEGLYTKKEISDKMTVYWRLLKEVQEIEIVMKAKTTSWVALGWRPQGLTGSCKKFPVLAEEPSSRSLKLGDTSEDSESEPEPESEPSDDKYDIDAEAEAETEPSSAAQTQSKRGKRKITSVDVGISYVSHSVSSNRNKRDTGAVSERQRFRSRYRSQYRPRFPRAFSIPLKDEDDPEEPTTAEPVPSKDESSSAEPEPEAEAEPETEPEPEAEAEAEPESEPEAEAEAEPVVEGGNSWTPRGNDFHAMDCTDIVVGMARGDTSRVFDYYTRDRSTPLRDSVYDGEDDLTAAIGWEEDGETTIIFRKKMAANGPTDHSIIDDQMHVIWATGQEQGQYSHRPHSGLESKDETASVPNFYHDDELKYHGKDNRGVSSINFHDEIKLALNDQSSLGFCGGEWKYPRSCKSAEEDCQYMARWEYNENTDRMNFTISSRNTDKKKRWTGIGFSDNPLMRQTDAIIGWVEPNGKYFIMDMWTTNYLNPVLENKQDIFDMSGKLENGVTTISFSRPRDTGDSQDVGFTDTEGRYMIFPVKGGWYNGVNKKIKKHDEVPIASSERIFIKSCRTADGKPTFTTTPKPPQLMLEAKVRFVDLGNYQFPRVGTKEFTDLQAKISRSLRNTYLNKVSGFVDVAVHDLYSEQQGEIEAKFMVIVDKTEFEADPDSLTVEEALSKTVEAEKIGIFKVDRDSLSVGETVTTNEDRDRDEAGFKQDPNVKLYVVVACIAALVLVAIIQATCTIFKMSRRGSSVQKEKLLGQNHQWKDYSGPMGPPPAPVPNHNYGYDAFDGDDKMMGWHNQPSSRQSYERYAAQSRAGNGNTHSLPRGSRQYEQQQPSAYPMGYSSFDRRGHHGGHMMSSRPAPGPDYPPPDHYFMKSQRKYSGENIRVYVDYNK